ncbi:MAG: tripartite tricarboxylate transporter substrate binding protein [Betaproteobacteria bacterium]|nr:tripartite tricarboxylate transporter substrate binding protein [Betaproteobacteria bacterium]
MKTMRILMWSLSAALFAGHAFAQEWPARPVRIIVITPPGGIPDSAARLLAVPLSKAIGQPVVVENRPGAGGNIATDAVAKALPDGHTLLLTGNNHAVNPVLIPNPGFDYQKDLSSVSMMAEANMVLVASQSFAPNNLTELIALAKQKPGTIAVAISPIGTPNHLGPELLAKMANIDINLILYKGIFQSLPDLISGQVQLAVAAVPSILPQVRAGKLKALAVTRGQRSPLAPEIPTAAESGLPGFEVNAWVCLMATGGTPPAVIRRINAEVRKAMGLPEVRESMVKQGLEPWTSTPEELDSYIKAEAQKWSEVLKTAKIKSN